MSDTLQPINLDFEGHPVTAIKFRGRWCWLAAQVGLAIGYTRGDRFAEKLTGDWADDAVAGKDFDVLRGPDLKDFSALTEGTTVSVGPFHSKVTVIYESGLHLALLRTRKPLGRKLRRALAEKVLPQLVRDGRYDPERMVDVEGNLTVARNTTMRELDVREREVEERLAQLALRKREMEAGALRSLVGTLRPRGRIREDILESLEVTAAEIESGRSLPALKPPADESLSWESPTAIAKRYGVSAQRIGRMITALELRGVEGLSRAIVNKAANSDRTVTSYLYSPEAVQRLERALRIAETA